jgi:hypothetical protein
MCKYLSALELAYLYGTSQHQNGRSNLYGNPETPNARHWYAQAGKPCFSGSIEEEWIAISEALLIKP